MRIAFVAPFGLRTKGTARARCLPLACSLAARLHTLAVFVPPYDSPDDSGRSWAEGGVDVINLPLPRYNAVARPIAHLCLAWRMLRAVRRWEPDLVHVFKPKGPSGLVGAALWQMGTVAEAVRQGAWGYGSRPRIVVDADDWEGWGGWNDDPRASYTALERRFFAWQERYGLTHADAWTVVSSCLRDRAIKFGADPTRVFLLPNGVPASSVPSHASVGGLSRQRSDGYSLGNDSRPSAILYTRFAGVRAESVAAIWEKVCAALPEARLTVLGRGLAGEEEMLRERPGIDVLGWVDPSELPATLAAANVALVPWADTLPNRARHSVKVLELMRSGLPIVGYAVGELAATVGEAGVLVEPGDETGFVNAVIALLRDRDLARRLGDSGRRRLLEKFTWDRLASTAILAYQAAERPAGGIQPSGDKSAGHRAPNKTNT
jgi:glycosyltransferase involved in cell wall biosynthesis